MHTIGVLSRWNATCGVSMHAELIGREFLKMGHDLRVFAAHIHSANKWWHYKIIREEEEDFVIGCYKELEPNTMNGGSVEEDKILSENFDYLIVESYASILYVSIERLVNKLRERGVKVIVVIHEGGRKQIQYSSLRIFDAVVIFDERYVKEMLHDYQDLIRVIPYPCHPVERGNRGFAEDVLTFFTFGRQQIHEYNDYIEALDALSPKYDFVYRVIRSNGLLPFNRLWLKQEQKRLDNKEIYRYLHSSDIHLIPKGQTKYVVVSSTLYQCLGALTSTVVPNTRHFEMLPEYNGVMPAVIYKNIEDLKEKLIKHIEDEDYRNRVIRIAEKYVEENRSDNIAQKFIKLFRGL